MSDDIAYNKTFDLLPGRPEEVAPNVRAVVANNPGPFTFAGTVSYIIGRGKVAILDPAPTMTPMSRRCSMPCAARR